MKNIIVIFIVLFVLVGCVQVDNIDRDSSDLPPHVTRFIDEEAGVVCYRWDDLAGGISCVPKLHTTLP